MLNLSVVKRYHRTLITFIIAALCGAVVFVNILTTLSSSSPSSSVTSTDVQSLNVDAAVLHSLRATFVRVEAADPASRGSRARLVLSVEAADLTDFIDAYKRGFAAEVVQYPDDGGVLLHDPELCRGKPLDWVVYVHTSPSHRRRRQLLRDTWANLDLFKHLNFRVIFLLGKPGLNSSTLQA